MSEHADTQQVDHRDSPTDACPARRTVLRAAGVVGAGGVGAAALAACGGSTTPAGPAAAAASPSTGAATSSGSASASGAATSSGGTTSSAAAAGAGGISVPVADIPVGGGKAFPDATPPYVVTQATAGQFKAFDGTCTHQGCSVTKVRDGHIVCPCHNSMFDLATGAPTAASPAKKPLAGRTATLNGSAVVIT
jgi:nitrite reductase/ring-hydroxylating ferredoxin subunit